METTDMDARVRGVFRAEARYMRCRVEGEDPQLLEASRAHLDGSCAVLRESLSGWAGPATSNPESAAAFLRLLLKHRSLRERLEMLELARWTDDLARRIPALPPAAAAPLAPRIEQPLLREVLTMLGEGGPNEPAAAPAAPATRTPPPSAARSQS